MNEDFPIILPGMYMYMVMGEDGSAHFYDREPVLIEGLNEYIGPSGCNSYFITPNEVKELPEELRDVQPGKPVQVVMNAQIDIIRKV